MQIPEDWKLVDEREKVIDRGMIRSYVSPTRRFFAVVSSQDGRPVISFGSQQGRCTDNEVQRLLELWGLEGAEEQKLMFNSARQFVGPQGVEVPR